MDFPVNARVTPFVVARGFDDLGNGHDITRSATPCTDFFAWLFDKIFGTTTIRDGEAVVEALHDAQLEMFRAVLTAPTCGGHDINDGDGIRAVNLCVGGKKLQIQEKISLHNGVPVNKLMIVEESVGGKVKASPMKFASFSQLKRACLIGFLESQKNNFSQESLSGVDLEGLDLTGVKFGSAPIDPALLPAIRNSGGKLEGVVFSSASEMTPEQREIALSLKATVEASVPGDGEFDGTFPDSDQQLLDSENF